MAGVRKKPNPGGKYHGWFTDTVGDRKFFTGTRNRSETLRMAKRLEDEHRQIRLGYRPAPTAAQKHRTRLFEEVRDEYLAWGQAQGGWRRKPWSPIHARNRRTQLTTWQERLGLKTLADLDGIQPRVERALRDLQAEGKAGKTLANYTEGLTAFCDWCVQRGYLANDPLKAMVPFDTTPQTTRRAMTLEEIAQVLKVADPPIRLLYETAFVSGLRANELRNLTLAHLDLERGGLILDAEWTKNRRKGFQPLPYTLIQRLVAFSDANQAQTLYKEAFSRGRAKQEFPKQPLLYVPSHPARSLDRDLKKAGIPKHNPHGKLDFHAARVAYINLLIDNGSITPKEVQELARHSTLDMTMRVYGRTQEGRMREAVEQVGESVLSEEKRATSVQKLAVGAEREIATPNENKELRFTQGGSGGRARTSVSRISIRDKTHTKLRKIHTKQDIIYFATNGPKTKIYSI